MIVSKKSFMQMEKNIVHSVIEPLIVLTKPKVTFMALFLSMAGYLHGINLTNFSFWPFFLIMIGIYSLISGASALNMYYEKHEDSLMERTKNRPLPSLKVNSQSAFLFGIFLSLIALIIFWIGFKNLNLVVLSLLSLILYVWVYTPLKKISPISLLVGSIPGAMPVVLGYAATFSEPLDKKCLALFIWAFFWQIPHFLAISIFRCKEYEAAGFKVYLTYLGEKKTIIFLKLSAVLLVLSSFILYFFGATGKISLIVTLFLGLLFLLKIFKHDEKNIDEWAKKIFLDSLSYQSLFFLVVGINAVCLL